MTVDETSGVGFRLYAEGTDTQYRQGRASTVIGYLHSPTEFVVGEDPRDGTVWILPAECLELWPLNSSRSALEACMAAFDRYLEDGPEDSGPVVRTLEEMREDLDRMKRGELKPRKRATPALSHRKRVRRLLKDVKAADPSALNRASWWAGPLEEAKDDLI